MLSLRLPAPSRKPALPKRNSSLAARKSARISSARPTPNQRANTVSEATLRVFIDTNILFSARYSPSGTPSRLLQYAAGTFQPVLSDRVLDELVRNLLRKQPVLLSQLATLLISV